MHTIAAAVLRDYVRRLFVAVGAPEADAETVAAHLVEANLKGHDSHGVVRVPGYLLSVERGLTVVGAPLRVERESDTTAVVDGGWNFGQVVARDATRLTIERAQRAGVAVTVVHRANHVGRLGAYVEQMAAAGLLGVAMANIHGSGHIVAPFGGTAPRLGTNPLAFGFPTADPAAPFVLDMATSVAAEGKMRVALHKGQQVPPNWLLDAAGRAIREPAGFYGPPRGAILPLGGEAGHKGFGLSLVVDALAGALSPAGPSRPDATRGGNALFLQAIDPERFGGREAFSAALGVLLEWVKRPPFAAGVAEVLTPGEPERQAQAQREAHGIPIDDETWRQIAEAAARLGVAVPAAARE